MADLVVTSHTAGERVATLTLNRPELRNPTSIALLDAMDAGLDEIMQLDQLHVLRLAGAGRSFRAGLDLDEVAGDEATIGRLLRRLSEVMRRLRRLPVATIALVQGAAIGGGFGFMAVCDFRITHADAKIGYPPLATGLSPALMAPWLVRIVGPARARARLLGGGTMTGQEAYDLGIATHITAPVVLEAAREEIERLADELTENILTGGRHAMVAMKTMLNELDGSLDDAPLDRAAQVSANVIAHAETQERLTTLFRDRVAKKR